MQPTPNELPLEESRDSDDDNDDDDDDDDDPLRGATTNGDMAIRRPTTCSNGDRISDAASGAAAEEPADVECEVLILGAGHHRSAAATLTMSNEEKDSRNRASASGARSCARMLRSVEGSNTCLGILAESCSAADLNIGAEARASDESTTP